MQGPVEEAQSLAASNEVRSYLTLLRTREEGSSSAGERAQREK